MKLRIINVKSNNQSIVKDKKVKDMEFHAINLNNTSITLLSNDGFLRTSAIKKIIIETQNSTYELKRVKEEAL